MSRAVQFSAHAAGALATSTSIVGNAFAASFVYQLFSWSPTRECAFGRAAKAAGLGGAIFGGLVGLSAMKKLGCDRVAILGGCAVGFALAVSSAPVVIVAPATALAAGVIGVARS